MNKTVWITGASEGIGNEYAHYFAKNGYDLTLIARNVEKLQRVKEELSKDYKVHVDIYPCDLLDLEQRNKLICCLEKTEIDIFINDAGIGNTGKTEECSYEAIENIHTLNTIVLEELCVAVSKQMIKKKKGRIINICSTGAFQPGPYISSYYSSKAAVLSFSKAIHMEWKEKGILVQAICFGPVKTNFYEKSNSKAPFYAMDVDKAVSLSMKSKKSVVIVGLINKLCFLAPRPLRSWFIYHSKLKQISKEG